MTSIFTESLFTGDATSVDTESHIYNTEGSYNINITAENNMGRVDMQYVIHILKPIMDNMFIVETNAPIVYPGMGIIYQIRVP